MKQVLPPINYFDVFFSIFRDREEHLRTFLFHMHSYLPRQQLDYGIFVVEQHGSEPFNR